MNLRHFDDFLRMICFIFVSQAILKDVITVPLGVMVDLLRVVIAQA